MIIEKHCRQFNSKSTHRGAEFSLDIQFTAAQLSVLYNLKRSPRPYSHPKVYIHHQNLSRKTSIMAQVSSKIHRRPKYIHTRTHSATTKHRHPPESSKIPRNPQHSQTKTNPPNNALNPSLLPPVGLHIPPLPKSKTLHLPLDPELSTGILPRLPRSTNIQPGRNDIEASGRGSRREGVNGVLLGRHILDVD